MPRYQLSRRQGGGTRGPAPLSSKKPTPLTAPSSPFAPFRHRSFLIYWLTGLAGNFGWLIQLVGASWLMTSLGGTPELVALVQTSIALPVMLFSLPAGAIADSLGRRTVVIWSQSMLLAVSVLLAVFAYYGWLTPWGLLAFTFVIGSCKAMNNPGWLTMVSELMPRAELPGAIAMNSVGFNIARSVGPAIGGAIVATIGAFAAFLVNAVSNIGVILVAWQWPRGAPDRDLPPESVGSAMMTGLRYVALSPTLVLLLVRSAMFNLSGIAVLALMPLVARDLLDGGPQTFGNLLGAFGVGAVAGALNMARLRQMVSLEGLVRLGFVVFALASAAMGLGRSGWVTLPATALAGAAWLISMSTFNTTVQMSSPRWVLSRCHATYQAITFGANALGSILWGIVAGDIGTGNALLVSAGTLILGALMGRVFALREMNTLGLDPHANWTPPQLSVDMVPKSGPIITSLEYRIREDDIPEFLELMSRRRRNRTRDGARRWTLSRNLQDPEIWIERYKSPTWVDHERHLQRRTVAGAELAAKLRALHQGEGGPKVNYELVRHPDARNRTAPPFWGGVAE